MFSTLRTRFGIPGVISVIALVFAMLGGAYAASNFSGGGKATASAKVKKGPRGPKGPKGATGPAGPQGPAGLQGSAGANGKEGANGSNGKDGSPGAAGTSVTAEEFNTTKDGHCIVGGTKFTSASGATYACNGEEGIDGPPGEPGPEGSPWVDGGTLPPGESETGAFAFGPPGEGQEETFLPISFNIPLAAGVPVHYMEVGAEPTTECPGTVEEPKAAAGNLCVYKAAGFGYVFHDGFDPETNEEGPTGKSGALLYFEELGPGALRGNWIVTAPTVP
jgi:hypothetical protein